MTDPFAATPTRAPIVLPPPPTGARRPRILAHVLRAMPAHAAGAERMLHSVLEGLVARGWDTCVVAVEHRGPPYTRNGVLVQALRDNEMEAPYSWCDIAVTHLDVTSHAVAWASYGRPLLHLVHNHRQLAYHRVPDDGQNWAVWNSEWIAAEHPDWTGPSIIVRPPMVPAEHKTTNRARATLRTATLVNLLGEKGGPLFWRLADRMPDWRFLGVEGAYGFQSLPRPDQSNAEVVANQDGLRDVYARTSVLLAPSWYESWSLSAVEALASGIPVVAHPTPGLLESQTSPILGPCAIFVDRDDDQGWVDALTALSDRETWAHWSALAKSRAAELGAQSKTDLDRLDRRLRSDWLACT